MGVFESSRHFERRVDDLSPVALDLIEFFELEGFNVKSEETPGGGWVVSVNKGGLFHSVVGMKTALTVELERNEKGVEAKAGVGIFGLKALPTAVMYFVGWPVVATQVWGLIQQSKLDVKALDRVELSVERYGRPIPRPVVTATIITDAAPASSAPLKFCPNCGIRLDPVWKFCGSCGGKL